jgi:transposase
MVTPPPITSPYAPDLEQVRAWLQKMIKALRFIELVAAVLALIGKMRDANTELVAQLSHLRRARPRSETLERLGRQLTLPLEATMALVVRPAPKSKDDEHTAKRKRRGPHPGRAALPASLQRVPSVNPVPAEARKCPLCGTEMTTVGHAKCERLDVIPAKIVVIERLDERIACPKDNTIVSAPTPPAIVEGGKLGDTLIVEALCDKYIEHQPIERQCTRWQRAGIDIAPQTLGRSVAAAIDLLRPVAKLIEAQTRAPGLLGTDATGIPILDPVARDGIRTGAMWCWTNARWVTFFYAPSADSDSVRRFLGEDLARTVQCDGTNVTSFLERAGGTRPGCWSHGRRRLAEAARSGEGLALDGLRIIAKLFAVERASTLAGESAKLRLERRQRESQPVLDELRAWLDEQRGVIPPRTMLGKGLGYLHRQWHRLVLFMQDGNIELTNNRRERELRRLVLGRRNWLFTWLDLGGERTAHVLTIVGTCIAHGVNPRAYLHLVTKLVVRGWPQAKLRELLPDQMLASHPQLSVGDPLGPLPPADMSVLPTTT